MHLVEILGCTSWRPWGLGWREGPEKGQEDSRRAAGKDILEWCLKNRGRAWAENDGHFLSAHCMLGTDLSTHSLTHLILPQTLFPGATVTIIATLQMG